MKVESRGESRLNDRTLSLPANAEAPGARDCGTRVPVEAELGLTVQHPDVRAVYAIGAVHRSWKVDDVFIFPHDAGVVGEGEDALHGRAGLDVAVSLIPEVVGAAVAVLHSVIVTEPEGSGGKDEAVVEGLVVSILVSLLLVLDPEEPAAPKQSRTRVGEGEEREVGVLCEQARGNLGDPLEVVPEVLGLDRLVTTEAAIPKALGMDPPLVHAAHLEATDQVLDLGADAFLAGAQTRLLDLIKFGHMAHIEQSHLEPP